MLFSDSIGLLRHFLGFKTQIPDLSRLSMSWLAHFASCFGLGHPHNTTNESEVGILQVPDDVYDFPEVLLILRIYTLPSLVCSCANFSFISIYSSKWSLPHHSKPVRLPS